MAIKLDKTKLVRNLAARHKLVPHLERAIGEGDFEWSYDYVPKKGDDGWHPSGDCTPSLNQLFWKATDPTSERFGSGLLKTFQVGHFWHAYLQHIVLHKLEFCEADAIERRGVRGWGPKQLEGSEAKARRSQFPGMTAMQSKYQPFHYATGSGDVAPCDIPGHGEYIVDFKTMGSHDFKPMQMPDWCAAKYECQINIYMDFFDIDRGLIVCIQKDSPHDMKEFEFERNQPLIDAIYMKWELVAHCIREGIEPPVDEDTPLPLRGAA